MGVGVKSNNLIPRQGSNDVPPATTDDRRRSNQLSYRESNKLGTALQGEQQSHADTIVGIYAKLVCFNPSKVQNRYCFAFRLKITGFLELRKEGRGTAL